MNRRRMIMMMGQHKAAPAIPWYLAAGISQPTIYGVYQFIGASSEADALSNRANPGTHDLTKIGSPVFNAATGMRCTGNNAMATGWLPSGDDYFVMIRFTVSGTDQWAPIFGLVDTDASNMMFLDNPGSGGSLDVYAVYTVWPGGAFLQSGTACLSQKGVYRNGVSVLGRFAAVRGTSAYPAYLGNANSNNAIFAGNVNNLFIEAAIICNGSPSDVNIADLHAKMAALPTVSTYTTGAYSGQTCTKDIRYSVFGDSISITASSYWPLLAPEYLNGGKGYVRILNHSVNGYTITNHIRGQAATIIGDDPDRVIVTLGTNDTPQTNYADMLAEYEAAIDIYLANSPHLTAANIFCLGILNKTVEDNRALINSNVIQTAATAKGCTYINTDGWLTSPGDFDGGGVHPTVPAGQLKLMQTIAAHIA